MDIETIETTLANLTRIHAAIRKKDKYEGPNSMAGKGEPTTYKFIDGELVVNMTFEIYDHFQSYDVKLKPEEID